MREEFGGKDEDGEKINYKKKAKKKIKKRRKREKM